MIEILFKRTFGFVTFVIGVALIGWFVYNQFWPTDGFKRGFLSVILLIVPIAFVGVGWKWARFDGRGIEEVTPPDLQCPELEASILKARDTLPAFLSEVEKGIDGAFIKFPLSSAQGMIEHIWAYVHFFREGQFNVSLANQPIGEDIDAEGRRFVPIDEVEDWQIMEADGMIRGAFSVIALFEHRECRGEFLSPKMRKQKALLIDATR